MALNLVLVGNKIQKYREQLKLTIQELSAATGIPTDNLKRYEIGKQEPTGDEILILSDFFRCDYKFFISNEKLAPFEETEQLYRRFGSEFSKRDRRNIQDFLFLCENEEFLVKELGLDKSRQSFLFQKSGDFFKAHGENAAERFRTHIGYRPNEVGMNIYSDIRSIGVHVFRRRLGNSNISGLYIRHPTAGKCVLINYSEDIYRQRFSAGHELAHTILDDEEDFIVSFNKWNKEDLVEIRANTFSSRYLMPPDFLRQIPMQSPWNEEKVIEWAGRLKVSASAFVYALMEVGVLNSSQMNQLRNVKVPHSQKIDPELPDSLSSNSKVRKKQLLELGLSDHYVDLCFEAYSKDIISRGRLAESLLVDDSELVVIADIYGRSLSYAY